jgi:DNA helicase MCM9
LTLLKNHLFRLAQGHARLMYRTGVTVEDAVTAITLMESSGLSAAPNSSDNALHSSFSDDAMVNYRHQGKYLLNSGFRVLDSYSLQLREY